MKGGLCTPLIRCVLLFHCVRSLQYVDYTKLSIEQIGDFQKNACSCFSNLALCHLSKTPADYAAAARAASQGLKYNPSSNATLQQKLLFRRGRAYEGLQRLDEALEDLKTAFELSNRSDKVRPRSCDPHDTTRERQHSLLAVAIHSFLLNMQT